jgi:hypothetical protein
VLEDVYQLYRDEVNFVWVYGSEAHPEENPFQEGYESCDLGWDHPYTITTTMEERAERARWLKTDPEPDFEIPMMIDYINTDLGPDNAIRFAYPGNFYHGAVIDCDGTILDEQVWAWYGEGGEWWGLQLEPIETLYDLLDEYLADPPDCYAADIDAGPDGGAGAEGSDESCGCAHVGGSAPAHLSGLIDLMLTAL